MQVLSGIKERSYPTVQLKAISEENPAEIFGKELQELRDGIDEFQSKTFESLYDKKVMWSKGEDSFSATIEDAPNLQEISASNMVGEPSHSPSTEEAAHESTSSVPLLSDDTKPTVSVGSDRSSGDSTSSETASSSSLSPEKQRTDEERGLTTNSELDPDLEFSESSTSAAVIARTKIGSSTVATPPSSKPISGESVEAPKAINPKTNVGDAEKSSESVGKVVPKASPKAASAKSAPEKPAVPAMFVMNEVALKTEPALTGESGASRDEDGVISLKSIPVDNNRSVVSLENDVKDVLRAQQAVTKSFISMASQQQTNEERVIPAIPKSDEVSAKTVPQSKALVQPSQQLHSKEPKKNAPEPVPSEVIQRSKSANPVVETPLPETLKKAEAVFKDGSNVFNNLFGSLLKNDPSFELSQKQKSVQPQVKRETKAVENAIQTPKSTTTTTSSPSSTAAVTKKSFVQPPPPPKPRGLEGLLGFLNSDPSFQYAQQQQEERKREEQEAQRALRAATVKNEDEDSAFSASAEAMLRDLPRPVVVVREKKGNNVGNASPRTVQKVNTVSPPVASSSIASKPQPKVKDVPSSTAPTKSTASVASKSSSGTATSGFSLSGLFGSKALSSEEGKKSSAPVTTSNAPASSSSTASRSTVSVGVKKSTLPSSASVTTPKIASTGGPSLARPSTPAIEKSKKSEGGLFGGLFGSKTQAATSTVDDKKPLSLSSSLASADAVSSKKAMTATSPATKVESDRPKSSFADSGRSFFGLFGSDARTQKSATREPSVEKTDPVIASKSIPVAKKGITPAATTSSASTTTSSSTLSKSKNDGGIFGGLFGGKNSGDKSTKKPFESAETTKTSASPSASNQATPTATSLKKTAPLPAAIATTTPKQPVKSSTGGLFGGLFGKTDSGNSNNNKQARAMNPAFQQLVSQQLRGDRVALQRFQSATDALRVGTLDAPVYLQELRSIFTTNKASSSSPFAAKRDTATDEVIRKVVPPLINEMPEREVAKKLATAYTLYLESLQQASVGATTSGKQTNGKGGGFFSNLFGGKQQKVDDDYTVKDSKLTVNPATTTSTITSKAKVVPSKVSATASTKPVAPLKASASSSSAKAGSTTGTTSTQLPDKVPLAKRNIVAQQLDEVARNRMPASALATYLIKDIGVTRSRPFVEELARLLPKEKAAEFLRAFEAAATK